MKKLYTATALTALLFSSITFATDHGSMMSLKSDPACSALVKACKAAGFKRHKEGKRFWQDCMHPLLLSKSVSGVTLDADQVKACRDKKITQLQNELTELQSVK